MLSVFVSPSAYYKHLELMNFKQLFKNRFLKNETSWAQDAFMAMAERIFMIFTCQLVVRLPEEAFPVRKSLSFSSSQLFQSMRNHDPRRIPKKALPISTVRRVFIFLRLGVFWSWPFFCFFFVFSTVLFYSEKREPVFFAQWGKFGWRRENWTLKKSSVDKKVGVLAC